MSDTYQVKKGFSAEVNIQRILLAQIDDLIAALTENPNKHKAIHESRKLCKRIRATLRLVRDSLDEEVYREANAFFRDASCEMAAVRDSVVLVKTLDGLADAISAETYQTLHDHLQADHERISDELLNERDVTAEVAELIQAKRTEFATLSFNKDGIDALKGLRRVYQRGRAGLSRSTKSDSDAHTHHDWRKRVKYFWHHCEMLEPVWPPLFADYAVELHLLSDFLGDAHDLFVLRETVAAHPDWLLETEREQFDAVLSAMEVERYEKAYTVGSRLFGLKESAMWHWVKRMWGSWQLISAETTQTLTQEILSDRILSVADAAENLNIPIRQLRAELRDGQRAGYKIGGRWVLDRTQLKVHIAHTPPDRATHL